MSKEDLIQEIIENIVRCQRPSNLTSWQKIGLSQAEISMLFMLSYHKQLQIKRISEYLGVSKSAASQMMDPLIKKGLVGRQIDTKDRRVAHLSLTGKGSALLKKIHKAKFAGFRARLESLSQAELHQLALISQKLIASSLKDK